jgi:Cu/Ag efflux protein CusF
MLKTKSVVVLAGLLALVVPGCSPKAADTSAVRPAAVTSPAVAPMADMPASTPETPATASPIIGVGKVVAVDIPSANLRLDHQPIPALGWMGMTMTFIAADPAILKDIKVGDTVAFEIKSKTESGIITKVQKQ